MFSVTIMEPLGMTSHYQCFQNLFIFKFFQDSLFFMLSVIIMEPLGMTNHYQCSQKNIIFKYFSRFFIFHVLCDHNGTAWYD